MRMWMVNPDYMCTQHIVGEHGELHKFMHCWQKHTAIKGRVEGNAMEPKAYKKRHDLLAKRMNHKSPLKQPNFSYLPKEHRQYKVDVDANLMLLLTRCEACRKQFRKQMEREDV